MITLIIIAIATFTATLFGGLFALRFKDRLHLILGFSAGAVIGVAFFDLIPEAITLGLKSYEISTITTIVAAGFLCYLMFDRFLVLHAHVHKEQQIENTAEHRGILGAGSLAIHSFLDGAAIGLSFQVSMAVGIIVTVAVLVHDFSDGMNTVNMILKNKGQHKQALRWLLIDACAPVLGVISTFFYTVPESALGIVLAIFSGFFLYIGASDLLPESYHGHPTKWTTLATVGGMLILYGAIQSVHW